MSNKDQLLNGLEHAIVNGKKADAARIANEVISSGVKPLDAIDSGLIKGMT